MPARPSMMAIGIAASICLLLTACTGSSSFLAKPEPQTVTKDSLVRPPWETLVEAGTDAAKDVDLETLNGPDVAPSVPEPAAPAPPPPVQKAPKPNATVIRAVAVLPVTGASPQGNAELTAAMRKVLKQAGWPVLSAPRKDALNISGKVALDEASGQSQPIHLRWIVTEPNGKTLGDIAQNNAVAAHSLDASWGEAAGYAAQAAAEGIFKLIERYR